MKGIRKGECAVAINDGKQWLAFESFAQNRGGTSYVRFVDQKTGKELLYYVADEWVEDPQLVMGCIMAAIQNGALQKGMANRS